MKVGIVGLGFMGATHAAAYQALSGVQLCAVSSRNERSLSGDFSGVGGNLGRPLPHLDFSGVAKYRDWEQLIAEPSLDAVDICMPTHLHEQIAVAALSAGKHVLCEKPMALTIAQCDRMLAAADRADRILMIAHVLRFWPAYEYLRNWIDSGESGPIRSATFSRSAGVPDWSSWLTTAESSGGAIMDLLIHDLDQIVNLFGVPAIVRAARMKGPDTVRAVLAYPNNVEIQLQGGWMDPGTPFAMGFEVRGERASLKLNVNGVTLNGQEVSLPDMDPFAQELAYFQSCCDQNRSPERCPPEQSAAAVKLALLVKRARELDGEEIECVL